MQYDCKMQVPFLEIIEYLQDHFKCVIWNLKAWGESVFGNVLIFEVLCDNDLLLHVIFMKYVPIY